MKEVERRQTMVETEQVCDALVVKPTRDIVASYVDEFRKELQVLVEQGHLQLVIDLGSVDMMDSKGLAVFMLCHKSLAARGGTLKVVTQNDDFKHLFHLMRMDEYFTVCDTI